MKIRDYEINDYTLAVLPLSDTESLVYENNSVYHVDKSTLDIIKESCLVYGSSYDGRKKGTEKLIGIRYKPPIVVDETRELIFFPTCSTRYHNTSWIGLKWLKNYYNNGYFVVLEYQNGVKINVNVPFGTINNQILRASRLESVLRGRKTF